jgi:phage baseplate assembly protein gpV
MSTGTGKADRGSIFPTQPALAEMYGLIANMVRVGRVVEADYTAGKVRVGIGDPTRKNNYFLTGWVPWLVGSAGNNNDWSAAEVGEQVVLLCASGLIENAIIIGKLNDSSAPHIANTADVVRTNYHDAPATSPVKQNEEGLPTVEASEPGPIVGMDEYNRKTGARRVWMGEGGTLRFDIGKGEGDPAGSLSSSIIMTKDSLSFVIDETQLVLSKDSIKAFVKGEATELLMTEQGIIGMVGSGDSASYASLTPAHFSVLIQNEGSFVVAKTVIAAALKSAQAQLAVTANKVIGQIKSSYMKLSGSEAKLGSNASSIKADASAITITSTQFSGVQGGDSPEPYTQEEEPTPVVAENSPTPAPAPAPSTGSAPSTPTIA